MMIHRLFENGLAAESRNGDSAEKKAGIVRILSLGLFQTQRLPILLIT